MMAVDKLLFVSENLSVELVCELVDSGVKVVAIGFGKHFRAADMDRGFGSLPELFDAEYDMGGGDVIEVAFQFLQLLGDVTSQGVCYIDVMSGNA